MLDDSGDLGRIVVGLCCRDYVVQRLAVLAEPHQVEVVARARALEQQRTFHGE
jgi:hypothetical protein